MTIIITAFESSPDRGQGLARDMRVRWALEEVGEPYTVRLLSFAQMKEPAHLAVQPFGQIPSFEEGDLVLFETGAIVLHIGQRYPGLLPTEKPARARAIAWMFAALNTVEPPIVEHSMATILERGEPWFAARMPMLEKRVSQRLQQLSRHLGDSQWLEGEFTAGDLLMASVLLRIRSSGIVDGYPNLVDYLARAERRPAYSRAFAAQRAVYESSQGNR